MSFKPNLEDDTKKLIAGWRDNIKLYMQEQLNLQYPIWSAQDQVCQAIPHAIAERKPIYIGSGHSLGKDFLGGCVSNWFLDCFVPSKVILTAPTDRQVKFIMWAETLNKFNNKKIKFGRAFNSPYIEIQKENWFLLGFTTKESSATGGGKFQGIRSSENQCIIVTEAQAVADNIYDQIDGVATAKNVLVLFLGNPTRTDGRFAKGLRDKKNNIVFNFSCLENPNYKSRTIQIPGLATYAWVEDKRKRWGENDPRWLSRVLGQIPATSINKTYGPELMAKMQARHGFLAQYSFNRGVAVDSAGEGMDDNVFMAGSGGEITAVERKNTIAPSLSAVKAVEMCKSIQGKFIVVDCDGIGIAVYQELCKFSKEYLAGIRIIKFHGSSKAVEHMDTSTAAKNEKKKMYANRRAEAAFVAQERAINGHAAVNIADDVLVEELDADEWFENKSGEIQLIDKKDIKENLNPTRSPGSADCWKMLQWAFDQEFEPDPYDPPTSQQHPEYALDENARIPSLHDVQTQAISD